MKCPYIVHRTAVVSTIYKYDDEGRNYIETTMENNNAVFCECHKENCGAWNTKENRCFYGGIAK